MSPPAAYSEDRLVEQPAIALFAELDWQTVSAMEEKFGPGGTLGRETSGEVVLAPRLRAALEKLNPKFPSEAITSALDELTRDRSAMTLAGANREICGPPKVARSLLAHLNKLLVLGWRQKIQSRARVRLAIEDELGEGLPEPYTEEQYKAKCSVLFEHVYEAYQGDGASVFGDAAA